MSEYKEVGTDMKYRYNMYDILGQGAFASVYKGKNKQTNEQIAVKVINKQGVEKYGKAMLNAINNEITILQQISQQNEQNEQLLKIFDCFQSSQNIYLILELCDGGTLGDILKKKKQLDEKEVKIIYSQILKGIEKMARQNIAHRDIKPDNIFIKDGVFKIGDFGFASQKQMFETTLGTPPYMAPEFYNSMEYGIEVDIWALGVMMHECLFGELFFLKNATTQIQVQHNILNLQYNLTQQQSQTISLNCQQILKAMITKDPKTRPSAKHLLTHPFFAQNTDSNQKLTNLHNNFTNFLNGVCFLFDSASQLTNLTFFHSSKFTIFALLQKANDFIQTFYHQLKNQSSQEQTHQIYYKSPFYKQLLIDVFKQQQNVSMIYNLVLNKITDFVFAQQELTQRCFNQVQSDLSNQQKERFYLLQLENQSENFYKLYLQQPQNNMYIIMAYRLFICLNIHKIIKNEDYEFLNIKLFLQTNNYQKFKQLYEGKNLLMF